MSRINSRRLGAFALVAIVGLALTACGDDDGSAEPAATTAPAGTEAPVTTEATGTAQGAADPVGATGDFCQAGPALDAVLAADAPDPAAVAEALEAAETAAPAELTDTVAVAAAGVRTLLDTGDFSVFETPELQDALAQINGYYVSDCGFNAIDVTARDYAFEGVPATLPAGRAVLTLTNDAAELHEAGVFRINDDVTETVEELLALPQEEVGSKVTEAGFAFAMPGSTGTANLDLEPGRYVMVCFIPTGMTPEAAAEAEAAGSEPEGEPHFMHGMVEEFTVEG